MGSSPLSWVGPVGCSQAGCRCRRDLGGVSSQNPRQPAKLGCFAGEAGHGFFCGHGQ